MPSQTEKAFKPGSPCPPPPGPGKLRLYSMRFCPYAQRTRLFLAAKGIEYETINISVLSEKPDWFFEKTPLGKVPVLEKDGKIVYESLVCNEYLDGIYPDKCITPRDPLEKARQSMVLALWDSKVIGFYYKLILTKDRDEWPAVAKQLVDGMQSIENALTQPFFSGDKAGALDYNLWPWFERFSMLKDRGVELQEKKFPKLTAWKEHMLELPEVKACYFPPEVQEQFGKSWMEGTPDYDIGLKE
ncbi:glutathione S-transferase omega-1-like [Branchiostoma lanceolatum]|uniref:glutathione S-transferase omega-1-like n=1 Tax=Branchiostoma lanceolatum TaxID=7740 RepID=UPI003452FFBF